MEIKLRLILVVSLFFASGLFTTSSAFANSDHQHHHHNSTSPFNKTNLNQHCLLKGHSLDNPCPHTMKHLGSKDLPSFIGSDCAGSPSQTNMLLGGSDLNFMDLSLGNNIVFSAERAPLLLSSKRSFLFYESIKPPPRFL